MHLLPAAAGSGKSSLTAALVHSGLGYYSDEVALIEPGTFLVCPCLWRYASRAPAGT